MIPWRRKKFKISSTHVNIDFRSPIYLCTKLHYNRFSGLTVKMLQTDYCIYHASNNENLETYSIQLHVSVSFDNMEN